MPPSSSPLMKKSPTPAFFWRRRYGNASPVFFYENDEDPTMHELLRVFTDRKGLTWIAVTAFFSILVLIPFNQYHGEIAGITLRPAAVLPPVCGILWGPAGAWGLGFGNIAGDFFGGSWSAMSIFGFIINVLYPYLAYRIWHRMMQGHPMRLDIFAIGCFWMTAFAVTLACMVLLAACGTIFFARPFESKFISYFGNNIFWVMLAGPVLLALIFEPARRNGLVYGDAWDRQGETGRM